ncbi:MAG: FAD-binding protein [Sphaerochaetaceae bacterium]|nr:FAD-binding protein [Sphaerochaetaceae bacterium]
MRFNDYEVEMLKVNTCVVGTGAAGYNAACRLKRKGLTDLLLISENRLGGTSRNTGSDKQTYYKLTLSGDTPDSVQEMAQTLFEGKAVDGDIALCEAALSAPGFLRLVELGIPFPVNRYGEYVGYKTDHDPRNRATSIGPYTSREMTRALEAEAQILGVPFCDHLQVIKVISDGKRSYGLLCLDTNASDVHKAYVAIQAENIVYATGGPAGIFQNSVYPESQFGATGLAFEAGVKGRNLTEWQFGLASVRPRWNVSGTYMQVLPRFVSTLPDGSDEREFLMDFFHEPGDMLSKVFLKGYQWPFDVRKIAGGSSIIDILVYLETCKGRNVYLDFTRDPLDGNFEFTSLDKEAYTYIQKAGALVKKPIERLRIMNSPAISFYKDKGVDLEKEMLQISLCAQHNNGGLDINCWWESNLRNFFVVGEAAGSHGVYRPGGSALNAGQVGSSRASEYIARRNTSFTQDDNVYSALLSKALSAMTQLAEKTQSKDSNVADIRKEVTSNMSKCGGAIRNGNEIQKLIQSIDKRLENFSDEVRYESLSELKHVYRLRDTLITQKCYLGSMQNYAQNGGKSRGSALYTDNNGTKPYEALPDTFTFSLDDGSKDSLIQEMTYQNGACSYSWRTVRPLPENDDFFENVWRGYRENGNVY